MKPNLLEMAVGALVLALGGSGISAQAASKKCTSETCACEQALRKNTVEALEAFLKKYPHSAQGTSACAAISIPTDDQAGGGSESTQKDPEPVQSSNSAD